MEKNKKWKGKKLTLIAIMGIYTFALIYTIHKYEESIKQYKGAIEDYKRALKYAKNGDVSSHTTYLQLDNQKLKKEIQILQSAAIHEARHMEILSRDNDALQVQIKDLKSQIAGDESKIQYESSTYKSNTYTSMADNQSDLFETMENFE